MARSALFAAAVLLALCGGASALFNAEGNGANQLVPSSTGASFVVSTLLDAGATQGAVTVILSNVTNYLMCHFHLGNATTAGPIVLWIDPISAALLASPAQYKSFDSDLYFTTTFTAANLVGPLAGRGLPALYNALTAGQIYFNVHTEEFPAGLIRQQMAPASEGYATSLSGANQSPPLNVTAAGSSTLVFSPDMSNATVTLTVAGVNGYFMAHLHVGNTTTAGGIVVWINPETAALLPAVPQYFDIGKATFTVTFTAASLVGSLAGSRTLLPLAQLVRAGNIYANVHSATYPNGIIRGNF